MRHARIAVSRAGLQHGGGCLEHQQVAQRWAFRQTIISHLASRLSRQVAASLIVLKFTAVNLVQGPPDSRVPSTHSGGSEAGPWTGTPPPQVRVGPVMFATLVPCSSRTESLAWACAAAGATGVAVVFVALTLVCSCHSCGNADCG